MGIGVFVEFAASTAGLMAAFEQINGETDKMASKGKTNLDQLKTASTLAAAAIGTAVVGVVGKSVEMGAEFEKSTNLLVTAAGESTKNLGMVREGILGIASSTGTTWQNLSEGMYTVEKAGYRGAAGLEVLRAAAQGAAEEGASLDDVTNAMTSVMASYHLKASDSVQVMNGIKTAAGEAKTTMQEFSFSLSTVIPIASANGISFAQVSGAIATLTQHGTSAQEATQELANTIRNLAAPNRVAQTEMQNLGLNVQDVSTGLGKRGLTGTIDLLVGAITDKMGPSGKVMLDAFNQSKSAASDANTMIAKMPASVASLAKEYQNGKITTADWTAALKAMSPENANLARQFAVVQNRASGFNNLLRSGDPAAQTFTDALKKATGGATGLNTVLMLSGENAAGFKERVDAVSKSMNDSSKDVEGWASTQKLFSVRVAEARQSIDALGISLGMALLPPLEHVATALVTGARFLTQHKSTAEALAITITSVLGVAFIAYAAMMAKSAIETIASFAKMIAAGGAWVLQQAASIAESIALWAMYAVEWVGAQAVAQATFLAQAVAQMAAWVASQATSVASSVALWAMYAAEWIAGQAVAMATWLASTAVSMAAWLASQVTSFAASTAAGAVWLAEHAAMAAVFIASNVAMAASATAAFIAENAATLGIVAGIALLVTGIIYVATHWSQCWDAIKAAASDASSWVVAHVKDIWDQFMAFETWLGGLEVRFATMLVNAGKSLIDGLISGIKSKFDDVKSTLGGLTNDLTSWKGPPEKDATLLTGAGQLIIGGLVTGLESQYATVKKSLTAFTAGLGSQVSTAGGTLGLAASTSVASSFSVAGAGSSASSAALSAHHAVMASDASLRASQHDETNGRLANLETLMASLPRQMGGAVVDATRQGAGR